VYSVDLATGEATLTTTLLFGAGPLEGDDEVTGAASTPDGRRVAIRTRTSAYLWERGTGDLQAALAEDACPLPIVAEGESIAFASDDSYYTVGDGPSAALHRVDER
jgi:hypothetical protein